MNPLKYFFSAKEKKSEVILYSYSKFIFVWPLIFVGFLFWFINGYDWFSPKVNAWVWISVLITVMLCLSVDVPRNLAIFWFTFIFGSWFFILWLEGKGLPILEQFAQLIKELNLNYSSEMGLLVSIMLSVVYFIVLIDTRMNNKWRFTPLEIEHHIAGKERISLGRGFKCIRASYPDLFEFLMGLSGKIVIYDSHGEQVLQTIEHIPFLPFRIQKIEKIMGEVVEENKRSKPHSENG